jgi:hypothetical protein
MKITSTTELMKNQKHAVSMNPASQFEALQTQEGHALFFSIGTDGVFYLTRENPSGATGWDMQDLSTPLAAQLGLSSITAKCFDVTQDIKSNATDIVLVVTGSDGNDYLLVSLNNTNTDAVWAANRTAETVRFTLVKFDDPNPPFNAPNLIITDVSLVQSGTTEYLIADVLKDPSDPVQAIFRYFVAPNYASQSFPQAWNQHDISGNLSAGKVTNMLGRKIGQAMDGVYTMGQILGIPQLQYLPLYTPTKKGSPQPTNINLPDGATVMALSVAKAPYTDLFIAANGGLYFQGAGYQLSGSTPSLVYSHPLLQGVKSLHVNNTATTTIVWGLNEQGDLFYMSCAPGSEGTTSAWSLPVAILTGVVNVATYVHNSQNNLVIFAHLGDDNTLVQLVQDYKTTHWAQRSILLPSTDPDDMIERFTFTTHIELTDDNNVALQTSQVSITPTTSCTAYINDVYTVMYEGVPLTVYGDVLGEITIVQAIDTLAGVSFSITDGVMPNPVIVNPFNNILDKLNPNRDANVQVSLNTTVKDELGNEKPLVDPSVSSSDIQAMEAYISQFIQMASQTPPAVPADGSQQPDAPAEGTPGLQSATTTTAGTGRIFGIQVIDGKLHYYDNVEDAIRLGVKKHLRRAAKAAAQSNGNLTAPSASGLLGSGNEIEILAGDGWKWLKHAAAEVEHFEVELLGFNIFHFFFTIAGEVYHFALKASHDLANGIHFVLNKIKVAFEDMIKWLGSIFAWVDIINTHKVLYQYFLKFSKYCVGNLKQYEQDIQSLSSTIKGMLSGWDALPSDSGSSQSASDNTGSKRNTPSSKWGTSHLKSNASKTSQASAGQDPTSLMQVLLNAGEQEGDVLHDAILKLVNIAENIKTMSGSQFGAAVLDVMLDSFLDSAQTLLQAFIEAAIVVLTNIEDAITETLKIPVISKVYKTFTGSDLSFLDLICLLVAIPTTVIYKLVNDGETPFTKDDVTAFENAADFQAIVDLCFDDTVSSPAAANVMLLTMDPWPPAELQNSKNKRHHLLTFSGNMAAMVGGTAMAIMGFLKANTPELSDSKGFALLNFLFYIPYVGPDITGHVDVAWSSKKGYDIPAYIYWNTSFSALGIVKAFIDIFMAKGNPAPAAPVAYSPSVGALMAEPDGPNNDGPAENGDILPDNNQGEGAAPADAPPAQVTVTDPSAIAEPETKNFKMPESKLSYDFVGPMFDAVLNVVWEGPVIWQFVKSGNVKDVNNILNLLANTFFNVSGLLAPFCAFGVAATKFWFTIAAGVCNLLYGFMSAATSLNPDAIEPANSSVKEQDVLA